MQIQAELKRMVARIVATVVLALAALPSWGAMVFTTFGPGDSYNDASGYNIGGSLDQEIAISFTLGFSATLDSIRVATVHREDPNSYTVYLASDNSGEPGAALETFSSLVFTDPSSILTINSLTNPLLGPGATYWIVMIAPDVDSRGVWRWNDQGFLGPSSRNTGTSGWMVAEDLPSPAVEVNATADIPEPSTVVLALTGLLALFAARHRARR